MVSKQYTIQDNIQIILLAILCCFNILPYAIQSITIIAFSVVCVFFNRGTIWDQIKLRKATVFLITIAWLLVLYTSILYSFEKKAGLMYIQKSINILIIPFIIYYCFPRLSNKQIKLVLKVFIFSNVIFVIYTYNYIIQNLSVSYLPELRDKNLFGKVKGILTAPYEYVILHGIKFGKRTSLTIHKTYLSLSLVFSIFSIFHSFIKKTQKTYINALWVFIVFFFSSTILYFFSAANIPLLFFGVVFLITSYFKKIKHKILVITMSFLSLISVATVVIKTIKSPNKVITTSIQNKLNYLYKILENDYNTKENIDKRALINQCSKTLFLKRPYLGYGLGEQHIHLTGCYAKKKEFVLVEGNYNTHNQYFFLLLSSGLFGLIPFFYMFFYFFKTALKDKNYLLILFIVLLVFNLGIENILSRINGILFFSIFLPLLYRFSTKNSKTE